MRTTALVLKLLLFGYLGYLLFFLATGYEPARRPFNPPFVIFVIDTIDLYIHEAGHFVLKPFGRFIEILGGSLFQCLVPLALVLVSWRQNVTTVPYGLFWLGENLVNVSVYIKDAPYKQLHLIASGLIHDWNWLLNGDPDVAEPLGTIVFLVGILACVGAIGLGFWFSVRTYREVDALPVERSP